MEANNITQAQLSRATAVSESTISEILAGKKQFSRRTMRMFAAYFKVDVSVLVTCS
jgi:transcriptional regulator with XRE-family HTH domain